jgi:hypothetical protein
MTATRKSSFPDCREWREPSRTFLISSERSRFSLAARTPGRSDPSGHPLRGLILNPNSSFRTNRMKRKNLRPFETKTENPRKQSPGELQTPVPARVFDDLKLVSYSPPKNHPFASRATRHSPTPVAGGSDISSTVNRDKLIANTRRES